MDQNQRQTIAKPPSKMAAYHAGRPNPARNPKPLVAKPMDALADRRSPVQVQTAPGSLGSAGGLNRRQRGRPRLSSRINRSQTRSRLVSSDSSNNDWKVKKLVIKPPVVTEPTVRVIPMGGVEEVGKNITLFEYLDPKNQGQPEIMLIDMGFGFPDADMPGVDYVIPDVSYLEDKKDRIRGVVITHGHLDHIGAVPYIIEKIGSPTIYSSPLTIGLIKKRLEEFGLEGKVKLVNLEIGRDSIQLGPFRVRTFRLNHSIPDVMGLCIETPVGRIVWATDWKFDFTPADGKPAELSRIAEIGKSGVKALFSESTNIERPGHSVSEREVEKSLREVIEKAKGRIIIATFSSLISRIQQIINASQTAGRQVSLAGRSMINNIEMAIEMKAMSIPKGTLVDVRRIGSIPPEKLTIVSTGAQGEEFSALTRIAAGDHKQIKVKPGDTVVLSSSPIPGNEKSVSSVMDDLIRQGAVVIYNKVMDVHTSGHAMRDDLKFMIKLVNPEYFIPIHGERHKLVLHGELAVSQGVKPDNILLTDNGQPIVFQKAKSFVDKDHRIPANVILVDGLGVGDVGNIVLRDRKVMAADGIFLIVVTVDRDKRELLTSPDIISRGFIYMRDNTDLVSAARAEVKRMFKKHGVGPHAGDWQYLKQKLRDDLGKFLFEQTERRPMVVPVVIEV